MCRGFLKVTEQLVLQPLYNSFDKTTLGNDGQPTLKQNILIFNCNSKLHENIYYSWKYVYSSIKSNGCKLFK